MVSLEIEKDTPDTTVASASMRHSIEICLDEHTCRFCDAVSATKVRMSSLTAPNLDRASKHAIASQAVKIPDAACFLTRSSAVWRTLEPT